MPISEDLKDEAQHFDARVAERLRHGHIPDLRRVEPCDWFYNNTWRRPYLVAMDAARAFGFARQHARPSRLLDVGCGLGFMTLEFARHGFHAVGVDISAGSLALARRLAEENPYREGFGSLRYVCEDFLAWEAPPGSFDTIGFFGNLHHMPEPERVLDKTLTLLAPGGRVLVDEPAHEWFAETNGAIVALMRVLLGLRDMWYEPVPVPKTEGQLQDYIKDCFEELREGKDKAEVYQSPHNNSATGTQILSGLRARFKEVECRRVDGFIQRVIGGVRGRSEEETRQLAEFLDRFDQVAVKMGLIQPGKLFWAGEKERS